MERTDYVTLFWLVYLLVAGGFFPFGIYFVVIKPWLKRLKKKNLKENQTTSTEFGTPWEENVFHNPDAMNDGQYVCYLEKEVAYLYTRHRDTIETYSTRFPTFDSKSLMRVMEQTFYKITDLLQEYDQKRWTAKGTLDQLRMYTRELFGPFHASNLSQEELADTAHFERKYKQTLKDTMPCVTRLRSGSVFNQMLNDSSLTEANTSARSEKSKTRWTW